jgi:hypothetical protein
MNAPTLSDWTGANKALLMAEFVRLRALLGDGDLAEAEAEVSRRRAMMPSPPAIDGLVGLFGLSGFERDLILLLAGLEMDTPLAEACVRAGGATYGTALSALPDPHWSALAPVEPLRRWRLVEIDERQDLTSARLQIDEQILHFLAGIGYLDPRLSPLLKLVAEPAMMDKANCAIVEKALGQIGADEELPVILLDGDDRDGQRDVAHELAAALGLTLWSLSAADVPAVAREREALAILWQREALLTAAGLLLETEVGAEVAAFAERIDGFVAIAGPASPRADRPVLRLTVNQADAAGQRELWREALGHDAAKLADVIDLVSGQQRLSARRIREIASQVEGAEPEDAGRQIRSLTRGRISKLEGLAQEIAPMAGWDDIVLPTAQRAVLEQVAVHVRLRTRVHEDWGFAEKSGRGLGLATLFWGDSGTGKTLAAEVLAHELDLPLYRIDLSAVVSKYIGETEKNLRKVFDTAEADGAILLFDEADALFGKRSEVKDSHDRYANIEVSYLLQRMEAYRGLAILTSNHKAALDPAFERRLRFIVHFPFPDAIHREAIWRASLPRELPVADLDFRRLARLSVSGGTIRNIALNAAFLAADDDTAMTMAHLLRAAQMDASKRETTLSDAETRGWV